VIKNIQLTPDMIDVCIEYLLNAGNNFGSDCPEEILWEIQELQDLKDKIQAGQNEIVSIDTDKTNDQIDALEELYS
jgi:hypothetical protein